MLRWKPFPLPIAAALGILAFLYVDFKHDTELAEARGKTEAAIELAAEALVFADSAVAEAELRAEAAEELAAEREAAEPAVAAIVAAAPDTCKPAIDALSGQVDRAVAEAGEWKAAYEGQLAATAALTPATENLAEAAGELADASRPSFWSKLKPEIGVGAAIGVDPTRPGDGVKKVVGVTLTWRVL